MKDFFKYAKNRIMYNIAKTIMIIAILFIVGIIKGVIK